MSKTRIAQIVVAATLAILAVFIASSLLDDETPEPPPPPGSAQVSWVSGVFPGNGVNTKSAKSFADFRGCGTPIISVFPGAKTWSELADQTWWLENYKGYHGRLSIAVPLTLSGATLGQVSGGAGNAAFTSFAEHLKQFGRGSSDLRIGWEFNGDFMPWSAFNASEFNGAYRRVAGLFRKLLPDATLDWNGNLGESQSGHNPFTQLYPGDDVVDVVGVDAYDNGYVKADSPAAFATWAAMPYGIDAWYSFAQRHGKKFALPEWGLTATGEGDNPAFIEGMYRWLRARSSSIAYESYFNWSRGALDNSLTDPNQMPRSSDLYKALWNGGSACG